MFKSSGDYRFGSVKLRRSVGSWDKTSPPLIGVSMRMCWNITQIKHAFAIISFHLLVGWTQILHHIGSSYSSGSTGGDPLKRCLRECFLDPKWCRIWSSNCDCCKQTYEIQWDVWGEVIQTPVVRSLYSKWKTTKPYWGYYNTLQGQGPLVWASM